MMKESGIDWIGNIPNEWKIKKIKYELKYRVEKNNPILSKNILSLTAKQGVIPLEEKEGGGNKPKDDYSAYHLAYPGDIVMNSMNILSGSVGLSKYFGCVSPVYYMLRPIDELKDVRYYNYIFQTSVFQNSLLGLGNGILIKESESGKYNTIRMRIPADKFGRLYIPVAPIDEQKQIADYLDEKCSEIDALIEGVNEEIDTLNSYKHSLITEVVTKGLDDSCEMKASDTELIKFIPTQWSVSKVKYLFETSKGLPITKADLIESGLPVISYGQIHSKNNTGVNVDQELLRFVEDIYKDMYPKSKVEKYDFVFADTSEDYDGCGNCVYKRDDSELYAGYHSIILKSKEKKDNRYLAYLFKTDIWRKQVRQKASGVKVYSVTKSILLNSTVILPPDNEQQEIANYLDDKCGIIDEIIATDKQKIEKLNQYKKSLIFEYVTGKKQVI